MDTAGDGWNPKLDPERPSLFFVRANGCALGYVNKESGLPHKKPMGFITDMEAAVDILSRLRCTCDHDHQPIEGANCYGPRSALAAEWPEKMDKIILEILQQQMCGRGEVRYQGGLSS